MVFTVNMTVNAIVDTVVVHQVGEEGVFGAGEERGIMHGCDDGAGVLFDCCLEGELQADTFTFVNFFQPRVPQTAISSNIIQPFCKNSKAAP